MALGWANVIINEGLYDRTFVEKWCHGFEEYKSLIAEWAPERAGDVTGCDPDQIRAAARAYATTKPATMAWGTGSDHIGRNAVQANRAILALIGITGNLDIPGGNCFWPSPQLADTERWDALSDEQTAKRIGADRFKCLTLRPTIYAHPPSVFKAMLTEKPYPVKAMIVIGNNPAVCYPNTAEVTAALRKLDLLVVSEIFMTPTAALADIVLPAASNLERDEPRLYMHIKGPAGTHMDTSRRAVAQVAERRSDWTSSSRSHTNSVTGRSSSRSKRSRAKPWRRSAWTGKSFANTRTSSNRSPTGSTRKRILEPRPASSNFGPRNLRTGDTIRCRGTLNRPRAPVLPPGSCEKISADPEHWRAHADVLEFERPSAFDLAAPPSGTADRDASGHRQRPRHCRPFVCLRRDPARQAKDARTSHRPDPRRRRFDTARLVATGRQGARLRDFRRLRERPAWQRSGRVRPHSRIEPTQGDVVRVSPVRA